MKTTRHLLLLCALTTVMAGCASQPPLFYWGKYEQLIYDIYLKPGNAPSSVQIDTLSTDIQQAHNKGLRPAPGMYAHLAYMYAIEGKVADANAAFEREMALYPESRVLIEGMLKRAQDSARQGAQ